MATPADQGYTGPYGNMFGYIAGAGAAVGMPAGTNNQNAFISGLSGQYLSGVATSTLPRRPQSAYSTVSSAGSFATRTTIPGTIAWPARIGPQLAFFPNRNGKPGTTVTKPY